MARAGPGIGLGLGLMTGALIGSALTTAPVGAYEVAPGGDEWMNYCASKYRSFDPASGTYLGYDGVRHPCQ